MDEDAAGSRAKPRALDVFDDGSKLTELEDDPDVTLKVPVEEDEIIEDVEDAVEEGEEDTEEAGESVEEDDENAEEAKEEEAEEEFMDAEEAHMEEVDEDEMEDDYDLSDATAKSLARLRRDDLVRLRETRDLEAEGTKNQLVQNLLPWREQQSDRPSSCTQPSSRASTARAPSTARPGRHGHHSGPVLLRSDRVHVLQPPTTDPNEEDDSSRWRRHGAGTQKKGEELELDLESSSLDIAGIP